MSFTCFLLSLSISTFSLINAEIFDCNEPLSGTGGVELYAYNNEQYTCGFNDFEDYSYFKAQSTCSQCYASMRVNGDYRIHGNVSAVSESKFNVRTRINVLINGLIKVGCRSEVKFGGEELPQGTVAESVTESATIVVVNNDSTVKFLQLKMTGMSEMTVDGVKSVSMGNLNLEDSRLIVKKDPSQPFTDSIVFNTANRDITLRSHSSLTLMGYIHDFGGSLVMEKSDFLLFSNPNEWAFNDLSLIDSSMHFSQVQLDSSHSSMFLRRSHIEFKQYSTWFTYGSDIRLFDSELVVNAHDRFRLGGEKDTVHTSLTGTFLKISLGGETEFELRNSYWDLTNVDISLSPGTTLRGRYVDIFTYADSKHLQIIIEQKGSLLLGSGSSYDSVRCQLIGNITVPANAIYTLESVTGALQCRPMSRTVAKEQKIRLKTPNMYAAINQRDVFNCPVQNHTYTNISTTDAAFSSETTSRQFEPTRLPINSTTQAAVTVHIDRCILVVILALTCLSY